MQLPGIRRLNLAANVLLIAGLVMMFGGLAVSVVTQSETAFGVTLFSSFGVLLACMLLTFAVDRVKCPQCGQPFNRPAYGNWLVRNFAKTQTRRTCAHCGFDGRSPDGA